MKTNKVVEYLTHPRKIVLKYFYWLLGDEIYLKLLFRDRLGYCLNLSNPKTYNEKLQWLKLYNRNPLYVKLVDKYEVKDIVAKIIGDKHIIPTLGIYDSVDDIDFETLPEKFVLKCTHDSGGIVICDDKHSLNIKKAKRVLERGLKRNYYSKNREWPYKNVQRRIIAEQYMADKDGELKDYKFFCFDGKPEYMFIASDRFNKGEETKFDFYDMDFNHLPFTNGHPNALKRIEKPKGFEEMKKLSAMLSVNIPHVRVDFYDIDGKIYFGEMTFFHWSGIVPFEPFEWDRKFGDLIKLPDIR